MRTARFMSIAMAAAVVSGLGAVAVPGADAAQRGGGGGNELCVAISGGVVENATVIDVVADGGTGIGDASGGSGNLAVDGGNDRDRDNGNDNGNGNGNGGRNNNNNNNGNGNGNNNNNNNNRNNRNNWAAETLDQLAQRLQQTDTASSGNAGVATASADGGAVSIEDINSGGNVGNAISVGDTVCPGAVGPSHGGKAPAAGGGGGGRGGNIRALPSTGIGSLESGTSSLYLALGALGMLGLSLGSRRDLRVTLRSDR